MAREIYILAGRTISSVTVVCARAVLTIRRITTTCSSLPHLSYLLLC